jgi:MFS family permease
LGRLTTWWAFAADMVPLYALYALMFADNGLSDAQISALFLIWSLVGVVAEVPTGAIADRFSRRVALAMGGVLQGAGYAVWMAAPGFSGAAAGFVLWGLGGALTSGSLEALLYDGLKTVGATRYYSRLLGRVTAAGLLAQVPVALAASLLFQLGGYPLVGWVSVGCCLAAAGSALLLRDDRPVGRDARAAVPDSSAPDPATGTGTPDDVVASAESDSDSDSEDDPDDDSGLGYLATLRAGIVEAVGSPTVRSLVLIVAAITGLDALEEYFTLIAQDWGVPVAWIPLAELAIPLAGAAATWWVAHRSSSRKAFAAGTLAVALGAGALLLALSEWLGQPGGLAGVAVFYALYRVVLVAVNTRLQDGITGPARATVTSVASLLSELSAIAIYGLWALHGLSLIACLILLLALAIPLALRSELSR